MFEFMGDVRESRLRREQAGANVYDYGEGGEEYQDSETYSGSEYDDPIFRGEEYGIELFRKTLYEY